MIDGGYIEGSTYHFYLTDHLGNNRAVANASGTAVQRNHYYPFGMPYAETPITEQGKQPYKYNGKELDQMHGLNHYDFSARYMDGIRFTSVDPHAERYYNISPYVYCANNPIRIIDPSGKDTVHVAYNNMDTQDYRIQAIQYGGEDIIVADNPLPEVVVEGEQFKRWEYFGLSYSAAAVAFIGIRGEISLGYIPNDGLFTQLGLGFAAGGDVSHSVSLITGDYNGIDAPNSKSLRGRSNGYSLGIGLWNIGTSEDVLSDRDIDPKTGQAVGAYKNVRYGENWNISSQGISLGSKTIFGGHIYNQYNSRPLYLYKNE